VTGLFELGTAICSASILPNQGAVKRLARFAIPDKRSLALVGDADGGDAFGIDIGHRHDLGDGRTYRGPQFTGVVLDPPRLGKVLGKFPVLAGEYAEVLIDQQAGAAGGSLVDGEEQIGCVHSGLWQQAGSIHHGQPAGSIRKCAWDHLGKSPRIVCERRLITCEKRTNEPR